MAEDVDEGEAFPDPWDWRNWEESGSAGGGGGDGEGGADGEALFDENGDCPSPPSRGEAPSPLKGRGKSGGAIVPSRRGGDCPDRPTPAPSAKREGSEQSKELRYRHDGFTPEKQRAFLAGLEQTGCVDDACRMAGISDTTAYRTRAKLPDFARAWNAALARAAMPLRALAWERATTGAEIKVIRGGKHVESRFKPSDSILRLLMQGAEPDAYGRPFGGAGGARGKVSLDQLDAKSRKQVRQEAYRQYQTRDYPEMQAATAAKIMKLVRAVKRRRREERGELFEDGAGV